MFREKGQRNLYGLENLVDAVSKVVEISGKEVSVSMESFTFKASLIQSSFLQFSSTDNAYRIRTSVIFMKV